MQTQVQRGAVVCASEPGVHGVSGSETGKRMKVFISTDFEGVAGIKDHDEKILNAWRLFSDIEPKDVPPLLRKIVDKTVALANKG